MLTSAKFLLEPAGNFIGKLVSAPRQACSHFGKGLRKVRVDSNNSLAGQFACWLGSNLGSFVISTFAHVGLIYPRDTACFLPHLIHVSDCFIKIDDNNDADTEWFSFRLPFGGSKLESDDGKWISCS